ncbi:MAG: hypothetical protein EHM78_01960 [Myxococcaceae bacterium]|nr:MAG: hypothetical protein EHM78_01960 [Myxococcaceae bacterium]
MTTYIVDGRVVDAATPEALVRHMHRTSHSPVGDDTTWMKQAAERIVMQTGGEIRTSSFDDFVKDLLHIGLIELAQEK